jgi:hypothetical protein
MITGVRAYQASMDDLLSRDGVGDEVYAAAYVRRYNRQTGQIAETNVRQGATYALPGKRSTRGRPGTIYMCGSTESS